MKIVDVASSCYSAMGAGAAIQNELLWKRIGRHTHCVKLMEAFHTETMSFFVMERCSLSLMAHSQAILQMDYRGVWSILADILLGLQHLHALDIVHRDIKPANCLLGGSDGRLVKICDFGHAARMPEIAGAKLKGRFGTVAFMSPEMVGRRGHSLSTDLWSFAATAYKLIYGHTLYEPGSTCQEVMAFAILIGAPEPRFQRRDLKEQPTVCNLAALHLKQFLVVNPGSRSTAKEALKQSWLEAKDRRFVIIPDEAQKAVTARAIQQQPVQRAPRVT